MTAQPEIRVKCDRCLDETTMPMQNVAVHARLNGPEGWLVLVVGTDPSTPPSHLCPPCAFGFKAYIEGKTLTMGGTVFPTSSPPPSPGDDQLVAD